MFYFCTAKVLIKYQAAKYFAKKILKRQYF